MEVKICGKLSRATHVKTALSMDMDRQQHICITIMRNNITEVHAYLHSIFPCLCIGEGYESLSRMYT